MRGMPTDIGVAAGHTRRMSLLHGTHRWVAAAALALLGAALAAEAPPQRPASAPRALDHSGHKRVGKASFYARKFYGRRMADGTPMRPNADNAASKTLPLGTKARVTNLETGQSADVTIQDRGPYVKGRIVDLSPATAEQIGLTRQEGVTRVEVAPIVVPQPDGSLKPGAAAPQTKPAS
jgi:rare lipoprotein A